MRKHFRWLIAPFLLYFFMLACEETTPTEPTPLNWLPETEEVNGEIFEVQGIPVIRIWGTPDEMGYAHGYLLGPDIVNLLNEYLADPSTDMTASAWTAGLETALAHIDIPDAYDEELQGILDGMEARAGGSVFVAGLDRDITLNDLRGLQSDLDKMGCSSFAAWGTLTEDGGTLSGRNMDFNRIDVMMASQLIQVRIPTTDSESLAWVGIGWPGEIGCTTGVNEEGVSVSQQDVYNHPPSVETGFTPDNLVHRMMVESARPATVFQDVEAVLTNHVVFTGCAPMISWPFSGTGQAAVVYEFDGNVDDHQGFTRRDPESAKSFITVANHFRERSQPMQDCWRYNLLHAALLDIEDGASDPLTVEGAWDLLKQTGIPESVVMHAVVFDPNQMQMHVAFTENEEHAPFCSKVTLDVSELLSLSVTTM